MESVLVCIVSIALMMVSVVTMTMNTVQSASTISDTWKVMEERSNNVRRTEIVSLPPGSYSGGNIDLTISNEGQTSIADYSRWDVIVESQGTSADYLIYSPSYPPETGQWAVKGIFISANITEVFDLNILDPGEQAVVGINPEREIEIGQFYKITLSTSQGVTSQCYVNRILPPPSP